MNEGGACTLIFYRIGNITREPLLNLLAAGLQGSSICHCEIALGEPADDGAMTGVLRIFNDAVGVEYTSRTGRNPSYTYLSLGCSTSQLQAMRAFAQKSIGKPFSQWAMAVSLIAPRVTNHQSYFCAELVASCLQAGGLLNKDSNPAAATPSSLHALFARSAATEANPWRLKQLQFAAKQPMHVALSPILPAVPSQTLRLAGARSVSPPKGRLRLLEGSAASSRGSILTFNSLRTQ